MKKKKDKNKNTNEIIIKTEKHIIKPNGKYNKELFKSLDNLCFSSKNVYHCALYYIRQCMAYSNKNPHENTIEVINFINKKIINYNNRTNNKKEKKILEPISKEKWLPNKVFLEWMIKNLEIENPYGIGIPKASSQQIVLQIRDKFDETISALKKYNKNPDKFTGQPKFPKYKDKIKGRYICCFSGDTQLRNKGNKIYFPNMLNISIDTKIDFTQSKLIQARIIPKNGYYVIEIVYKQNNEEKYINKYNNQNKLRYIAIDIGIDRLLAVTNNFNQRPFIINGKPIKSINRFYNNKIAEAMSYVGNKGTSNKIKKLYARREQVLDYKINLISKYITDYCEYFDVDCIVIGHNKMWKQNTKENLSESVREKFAYIPFNKIIQKIEYKTKNKGVKTIIREEAYTSKCDALSLEKVCKHKKYKGKRLKVGLFQSGINKLINADINGSLNILKKEIGDDFMKIVIEKKINLTPLMINFKENELKFDPSMLNSVKNI